MDPANSNSRSPQNEVIAARQAWAYYVRLAFTSFRNKLYSVMSRSTVYRYAAHMQDMFQLTKALLALGANAGEKNMIRLFQKRHNDQHLRAAVTHLRSQAAKRKGAAAIQRFRHEKILAGPHRSAFNKYKFWPAGQFKSTSLKSSIPTPRQLRSPICQQVTAAHSVPPSSLRETENLALKTQDQGAELAQLKHQLECVTADLEKIASRNSMDPLRLHNDQDFAQAIQDSLGEAALSPARQQAEAQASVMEAQAQLNDQLAVLAEAKERSLQRQGREKQAWDQAMHRRFAPSGDTAFTHPSRHPSDHQNNREDPNKNPTESLLSAAKEKSAFNPQPPAREKLAGFAESSAAFGSGLDRILRSVPESQQSSDIQLVLQEIASLRNELLVIKNSKPEQPSPSTDFASLESQIMKTVDEDHVSLVFEDFVLSQDVLKRCLRPGCNIVQIPGSRTCACGAPRNMLDFRCPDPNCGMRQAGTIQDMLNQYDCRHCFMRLPWAESDPAARAKIRQSIKTTTQPVFDTDPPVGLKNVFWTKHKVTQCEDSIAMLIRNGNSDTNYMVAPEATSVKQVLSAIYEGAKAASKNNILGVKIKSLHNAKIVLGLLKLKLGKRKGDLAPNWHIQVTELISRAASHTDSTMEWSTQVLEAKPPDFNADAPSAILILHEMFRGMTEYIQVLLGNALAQEHHLATELLIAAHYSEADVLEGVHYKSAARIRRQKLKSKKSSADKKDPTRGGSLTQEELSEYSAFQTSDAIASKMSQQPTLTGFRATLSVGEKKAPERGFKLEPNNFTVNTVRQVSMCLPSLAEESLIEVQAQALCVGMDVDIPSGIQHHRCGFKAIAAQVPGLLSSELFAEVLESSVRFLDVVDELEQKFEHLAAAEIVEVFLMRGISCHDAIFARHQPTSMFWLRTAFPRCLERRPVLITYMHEGLLRFQLYICAAGPDYTSQLNDQVVHVLVHEVHSYVLNWQCDWSTLDKVLLSLGKIHRFADVGINLCNTIERTLEATMPTPPDYLKGAEMLTSILDARLPEKGSGTNSDTESSVSNPATPRSNHGQPLPKTVSCNALYKVISHSVSAIIATSFDNSPIFISESDLFAEHGTNLNKSQAVKNVRAALITEYLRCDRLGLDWKTCTAPIGELLRQVYFISRFRQPIMQLCARMAMLMSINTANYQALAHCKWIMASAARAWQSPLTTEFCCSLRPSLQHYTRLLEKMSAVLPFQWEPQWWFPTSPMEFGFPARVIDLSFMDTLAHTTDYELKRIWLMVSTRSNLSHVLTDRIREFNRIADQLNPHVDTVYESADEVDLSIGTLSLVLEHWSAFCTSIGLVSNLLNSEDQRDRVFIADWPPISYQG